MKAAEMIGTNLQQVGWGVTGLSSVRKPHHASIQEADIVLVGTWVHGLFLVGQGPWGAGALAKLPVMCNKEVAAFCTFALTPAKTLDTMTRILESHGAEVVGGLALHRGKLAAK